MIAAETGYYRQPTLHGDNIVFVCETDLWTVSVEGGLARRLTSHRFDAARPLFSPDGSRLAFSAMEEGATEIYVMPFEGGRAARLTYLGGQNSVCSFDPSGAEVFFSSTADAPFGREPRLWSVPVTGGAAKPHPLGPGRKIAFSDDGAVVLTRREQEIARWKRYRGGTKGDLWIAERLDAEFTEILKDLDGNLGNPCWIGERLYFLADHEGHGNLYSCRSDGTDLKRHTDHEKYFARAATTDGRRIVYQCGAEIYLFDPASGNSQQVDIRINSTKPQLNRRFVSASDYLENFRLHPKGHSLQVTSRGKPFAMGNWEREVAQLGVRDGVRYRLSEWLPDGGRIVTVSDQDGEECIEVHKLPDRTTGKLPEPRRLSHLDVGRINTWAVSPVKDEIAYVDYRNVLFLLDLTADKPEPREVDKSRYEELGDLAFAPDGRWIAYTTCPSPNSAQIHVASTETGEVHTVTDDVGYDFSPAFDPSGAYLFFLSTRVYDPVYDTGRFSLGFPKGSKPFAVTLRKELSSPFDKPPRTPDGTPVADSEPKAPDGESQQGNETEASGNGSSKEGKGDKTQKKVEIDFEGIGNRIVPFPMGEGRYDELTCAAGKVFILESPVKGSLSRSLFADEKAGALLAFDLESLKAEPFADAVAKFHLSLDGKALAYQTGKKVRVVKTAARSEAKDSRPGRESGFVDLGRIRVSVVPAAEWRQMYRELWRLQREYFWTEDMSRVDWEEVYERYLPVLARVATRSEFSDFAWEVHGELGTSHAYEIGGDVSIPPSYHVGKLAADVHWDKDGWRVERVVGGDSWLPAEAAPLAAPGVNITAGDKIIAVDGEAVEEDQPLGAALVHKARVQVALTVAPQKGGDPRRVIVTPLVSETDARYRAWVEENRRYVHERSEGKLGYVHIPDMGPRGYAEFYRYYMQECQRQGMVVDARYNGGGHVSPLILQSLMQQRLGFRISRHGDPRPHPRYAVGGPLVCMSNELSGSDGDIFCHSFKVLGLGPLVGKRTWGGVVGIRPRNRLVDGTLVTQPEVSTWFHDVGWAIENYGTEPDVDVTITPHDWRCGSDPQLEKAVGLALEAAGARIPGPPEFGPKPDLSRPGLGEGSSDS